MYNDTLYIEDIVNRCKQCSWYDSCTLAYEENVRLMNDCASRVKPEEQNPND